MTNIFAVTFISPDGNEMTVEVDANRAHEAQDIFEANYQYEEVVEVKLVSNRRDF